MPPDHTYEDQYVTPHPPPKCGTPHPTQPITCTLDIDHYHYQATHKTVTPNPDHKPRSGWQAWGEWCLIHEWTDPE